MIIAIFLFMQVGHAQEFNRYDIIIHEIYADPTPSHGLPQSEYIEIKNLSQKDIDLKNFSISNGSSAGKINYSIIIKPDSLLILCGTSAFSAFSLFGKTQTVSGFPSLSNEKDTISIIAPNGVTLHAVDYDLSWYHDDFKQDGGWSLEMINNKMACLGKENWSASRHPSGGTPGTTNSITDYTVTRLPLKVSYAYVEDSSHLKIFFNASLAPISADMELKLGDVPISQARLEPPLYNSIVATTASPIRNPQIVYRLELDHIRDCMGNEFQFTSTVALFSKLEKPEVIINEILFNPESGGHDYIEVLNNSDKTFDLANMHMANRNSTGKISSISKISPEHWPLFPNSFIVFTEDCLWLQKKYSTDSTCWCKEISYLPSFPDDKGNALILNEAGIIVDELVYDEKWHNKLIFNNEGVALERIVPNSPTNDPLNWYSASSQSGYGTPGVRNSQNKSDELSSHLIELSNLILSPDNDGRDDFVFIKYHLPLNGYIANVRITDIRGQIMKIIARNELCGTSGQFRWDGLDARNNKVIPGNYIIVAELFHLSGNVKRIYKSLGVFY